MPVILRHDGPVIVITVEVGPLPRSVTPLFRFTVEAHVYVAQSIKLVSPALAAFMADWTFVDVHEVTVWAAAFAMKDNSNRLKNNDTDVERVLHNLHI